jgi:primosomal protein N' (replication factor Y)
MPGLAKNPSQQLIQVALPVPLPQAFDYWMPAGHSIAEADLIGCRVRVPFGRGERIGIIVGVGSASVDTPELRTAHAFVDAQPLFSGELLETLRFCARYYQAPLGEVLSSALPALLRTGAALPDTDVFSWRLTDLGRTQRVSLRDSGKPRRLAERLSAGPISEDLLESSIEHWRPTARALQKRGLVERLAMPVAENPLGEDVQAPVLTAAQRSALQALREGSGFRALLLDGVTGSGKTEVYLQAIRDCLARGRQALVLVPEIGLTPQMLSRFRARLGVPVHALHSGLADGERARTWLAMARGTARVLVGTRSAVLVPLPRAGLIVVDEEHDSSYKQQDGVRYHARDLALVRAKALAIPVLLGSATLSLESLHNAACGRYRLLRLPERAGDAAPPRVRVLDVRKRPLEHGLSAEVIEAIRSCLARGEQALVFKNRRGYAPALLCHDCGWTAECRRCDTPMTVHTGTRGLHCHHCGARRPRPLSCPDCAGLSLQPQGFGTERLEQALAARFPDTPLIRVDRETTRRVDAIEKHLQTLGDRPGILVGTQMLAKGHHLPRLTLVVVVGIDEGLFSGDFRAGERLAQLLIQVAGRAGRAGLPGEVLWQTHHPEHPLLHALLNGGYSAVAAAEMAQRQAAGFPPYAHLALLRAEALREADSQDFLRQAREQFEADDVDATAPMPAPMPRRAGKARGQLLLSSVRRGALQAALDTWVPRLYRLKSARKVRWSLDVDPLDLY